MAVLAGGGKGRVLHVRILGIPVEVLIERETEALIDPEGDRRKIGRVVAIGSVVPGHRGREGQTVVCGPAGFPPASDLDVRESRSGLPLQDPHDSTRGRVVRLVPRGDPDPAVQAFVSLRTADRQAGCQKESRHPNPSGMRQDAVMYSSICDLRFAICDFALHISSRFGSAIRGLQSKIENRKSKIPCVLCVKIHLVPSSRPNRTAISMFLLASTLVESRRSAFR